VKSGVLRIVLVTMLVGGLVVGSGAQPAAAFASTGTVTIEGVYYSSTYSDTETYPTNDATWTESHYWIQSTTCADSWTGTTTPGSGAGATCSLWLSGHHQASYVNHTVHSSSGNSMLFQGGYYMSNGTWGYNLRLTGNTSTLTGTLSSSDSFAGPVTATSTGVATSSSSCSSACSPDYYSSSQGWVALTLDYVIH
jgi:hypothetical protein